MTQPGFITLVGAPGAACEGDACLPEESSGQPDPETGITTAPPVALQDGRSEAASW